jgi:electron transfer flavoprotein alpha subunit
MSGILVIGEARGGALRDITFEAIGAAQRLRAESDGALAISVALVGAEAATHADEVRLAEVEEIIEVGTGGERFEAATTAAAIEALAAELSPALVLCGHSIDGFGFAPALAARGGFGFASDVFRVAWEDGGPVATRPAYGNKLEVELDFPDRATTVLMLRVGAFPPGEGSGEPRSRHVDVAAPAIAAEHLGFEQAGGTDVDITKAPFLLSVGRGIGEEENLEQFQELAERIGATLSVSRPLVDAGWISSSRQVGQSGKTVTPKVYLALGISGSVQHLAGIGGAETVIAVNSDPEAPIFSAADFGAVADLFEVAEGLEAKFGEG